MPRATIQDVAKAAGVSKATVSRVMSGNYEYMRADTRARVEKAVSILGFRPSSTAQSLTSKRTNTVAILISDIGNPFYPDVIHGVEDIVFKNQYSLFLCNTNYDLDRGLTLIRSLIDKRVDGIMLMSSMMSNDWLNELVQNGIPAVVLDWDTKLTGKRVAGIQVEYGPGIQEAVNLLVSLGHRTFAHVSGPLTWPTSRSRRDEFFEALKLHNISPENVPVIEGNLKMDGGRQAGLQIGNLSVKPTAIFAANDLTAIGVMTELIAQGLQIPQDISVIGLDDIYLASQSEPQLTTVALPRREIGELAMNMLLQLFKNGNDIEAAAVIEKVKTSLVIRSSTAKSAR
jgi:LacI family transcriptional regulator